MSKLGKNVVSQHMSWTFLPPFYCAWFSITENDIRLIRKLWFITFNNYPGLSLYSCLKWWSQWWFDPVAISLDIGKFLAAVVQWLIVINLQPCIQRVHSYFNYRWLIWEFRKYYPYTVGEARMRLHVSQNLRTKTRQMLKGETSNNIYWPTDRNGRDFSAGTPEIDIL